MLRFLQDSPNANDIFRVDNTSTTNAEYYGFAAPGTATSVAAWRIYKLTLVSGTPIAKNFVSGSPAYNFVWDNRTTFTYS